jgi:hypothetical protein
VESSLLQVAGSESMRDERLTQQKKESKPAQPRVGVSSLGSTLQELMHRYSSEFAYAVAY